MLWVASKTFGESFRHALAHGVHTVAAICALAGCFLDETPSRETSSSPASADRRDGGPRGFVPRDPGPVRTPSVDAATANAGSGGSTAPVGVADASTPSVTPIDAQVPPAVNPKPDAQVTPMIDAGVTPPVPTSDAQVDAAVPAVDAQVVPIPDAGPPPSAALPQPIHRYEFEGTARVALDSIGDAHGELQGRAFVTGMGEVQLGGMYEDAVVLPPRILQGVKSFTMLGWMVPRTEECTQRLFEFIYFREGEQRTQVSALYLAPYACPDYLPAVGYLTERDYFNVVSDHPIDARDQVLLGAIYDDSTEELQLIVNGAIVQRMMVPIKPRELASSQGSLGRSSPEGESAFGSSIAEFRIYDQALDAATLAEIARRGPDQL